MENNTATYEVKVVTDTDSDIQPTVASFAHAAVLSTRGIDTEVVRVVVDAARAEEFAATMEADDAVISYTKFTAYNYWVGVRNAGGGLDAVGDTGTILATSAQAAADEYAGAFHAGRAA